MKRHAGIDDMREINACIGRFAAIVKAINAGNAQLLCWHIFAQCYSLPVACDLPNASGHWLRMRQQENVPMLNVPAVVDLH